MIGTGSLRAEMCLLHGEQEPSLMGTCGPEQGPPSSCEPNTGFIESKIIREDWQCGSVGEALAVQTQRPDSSPQFPQLEVEGEN